MEKRDFSLGTAALILLAGSLTTTGSYGRDLVVTRTAKSGVDSLIAYERGWDRNCQPTGSSVTFTSQPAHGKASVVQGTSIIPPSTLRSGDTGHCVGQSIVGNEIRYLSAPGFHGRDHVSWSVTYGNGAEGGATDVTIVVK